MGIMDRSLAITIFVGILILLTAICLLALAEARRSELIAPQRILIFYFIAVTIVGMATFFFLSLHPPPLMLNPNAPWELPQPQ